MECKTIDNIEKTSEKYIFYSLTDKIMIRVDFYNKKVKFNDKDGNVITDPELTGLATKLFNSIKNTNVSDDNKELIFLYKNELKKKLGDDDIIDTMVKIFDYKTSNNQKTDFHYDFVKQMCNKTVKE